MKNSENKTILDYETVDFNKEENCLVIIDQTLLPGKTEIIELKEQLGIKLESLSSNLEKQLSIHQLKNLMY